MAGIDAVIFDWGGTLTPWHAVDFAEEPRALALAAVGADVVTGWRRGHLSSG